MSGRISGLLLVMLGTALALWITWYGVASKSASAPQGSTVQGHDFPKVLIDQIGRQVVLPHKPRRIVSLTLATDEILLALVEPSRLLAVTFLAVDESISHIAPEAAAVPHKIGADVEQVLALRPDLVFVASYLRGEVVKLLQDNDLPVFQFQEYDSIAEIQQNIRLVAQAVGEEARAEEVVTHMQRRLDRVAARLAHVQARSRVLFWGSYGQSAGAHTSVDDIIRRAGGENLAAVHGIVGNTVISVEQVLAMNPEVIFTGGEPPGVQTGMPPLLLHSALQKVDAVQHGRVYTLPRRSLSTISQYIVEGIEALAHVLHPEAAPGGAGL